MKKVIILRGVSGAGKSTVAKLLNDLAWGANYDGVICTADDYFINDKGEYIFDVKKLGFAHKQCQEKFEYALKAGMNCVICANTNTKSADFSFYVDKAKEYGYDVFSLVVENRHGNSNLHNVPNETLEKQEQNIKNSLKLR